MVIEVESNVVVVVFSSLFCQQCELAGRQLKLEERSSELLRFSRGVTMTAWPRKSACERESARDNPPIFKR